jgi:Tfp pilus assembly protein PilO
MEQLKRLRIPVLIGVATVVVGLIVYAAWISPEGSHLAKLQAQRAELAVQQTGLELRIADLKKEKSQLGANCQQLTTDLTEIPGTPSVDSFLQQVTQLAVSSGDPNTPSISVTQATEGAKAGVTPVVVAMTLSGTYGQMTAFLQGLDTFPRLFTVASISATGYDLTISGDIFYSTGQKNVCADSGASSA